MPELVQGWEQPGAGEAPARALRALGPLCENSSSGKTGIQFTK